MEKKILNTTFVVGNITRTLHSCYLLDNCLSIIYTISMENKGEYFLAELTVYQYSENKIKCDYSVIPITIACNKLPIVAKSGVSDSTIEINRFNLSKDFCDAIYSGEFRDCEPPFPYVVGTKLTFEKEGKGKKVSVIYKTDDLEQDDPLFRKDLVKRFNWAFPFAFKYKKFLKKKIKLNQI